MTLKININGTLLPESEAKISVFDHGFLYGDGIFEGLRSYNGTVFRLKQHLDRFWDSAKALFIEIPVSKEDMAKAIYDTLKANEQVDAYIRLIVTRGVGTLGLDAHLCGTPQIIVITRSLQLYSSSLYEEGIKIVTASTVRMPANSLNPRVKSLNYLNNILAKIEGHNVGCEEALMLNHQGNVAECTGDNIFVVRNGKLLTPPIDACILEGITRNAVIEVAKSMGLEVLEANFTRHDVYCADECFLTGSAAELIPVVEVDGRSLGSGKPGPVTKAILAAFRELVAAETQQQR
ncbi:MAG: branched-chain-amino-acid transaminase [Planctomycetia bacterium]|nr:branched-chain-amino-acid transaminase [Planctomycetia bacterium]